MKTPQGKITPELRVRIKDSILNARAKLESMTPEERFKFSQGLGALSDAFIGTDTLDKLGEARMRSQKLAQETLTEEDALAQFVRNGAKIIENPHYKPL